MIKVRYSKVCGRCMLREPLTSGMVGQAIHFEYSHDFDGLMITAVFTDGKNTINVVNPGNECVIPHEVLTTVGATVKVGIYAVKDDELVIPTIYATIGTVLKGADPSGDISADPTLPVWAQVQSDVGNLNDLTTEAKNNLVSAINEAAASGGGGGADWAQNDPDGDGYVANRPGGYMTDPVITDVDTFTITSAEDMGGLYMAEVAVESSAITISDYVIGDGVIVDFGGQSYSLTWQSMEGFPSCGAAVTGAAPDWSAAPFCIIAGFGEKGSLEAYYIYLQNAVTSPIQVKIKKAKQTPIKIPTKYLESDVYIVKVTSKSNEKRPGVDGSDVSYDVTVSATYDDIVAAINAGKIPILLGEPVLRDPMLCLVDISTDDVDGALPYLTFGGTYFGDPDRLYGTCVVIYRTGKATYSWYDSSFVNRLKDVDSAMSSTSLNPVQNWVIKKYIDDHVAGGLSLGLTSAAVGQIAKITAVDASGVPTAWAPVDMPDKLPNPNALTFTGAVTGSYDGSEPVTVDIPSGVGGGGSAFSPQLIAKLVADGTTTSILQNIDVAYPAIYTVSIIGEHVSDAENAGQYLYAKFGASDMYTNSVNVWSIQTVNNNYTNQFVAVTFALDSEKCFHVIGKAENYASNTSNWMTTIDGSKILTNAIFFYSNSSKIIPAGYTCSVWRWA